MGYPQQRSALLHGLVGQFCELVGHGEAMACAHSSEFELTPRLLKSCDALAI